MNKTILSVVPAPLIPAVSGGQKCTYGSLSSLGNLLKVISLTDTYSDANGHSFEIRPVIKHNWRKYFSIKNYRIIREQVIKEKPSSILLEQPFMGILVYLASRRTKVPYFVHAHNIEYMRFKSLGKIWWPILYVIERFTFKNAKGMFFLTRKDKELAIRNLNVPITKCFVTPYGVPQSEPIFLSDEKVAVIRARHGINMNEKVFMFFGVLKYLPNIEALEFILKKINPLLKKKYNEKYKILICGGGLSDSYNKLKDFEKDNIIYAGFVENIDEYTQSADVILNPVQSGGGIKTKIVEALGFSKNVVSTSTGAIGVDKGICGSKLYVAEDNDWDAFTDKVIEAAENNSIIPNDFFSVFSWSSVAKTMYSEL